MWVIKLYQYGRCKVYMTYDRRYYEEIVSPKAGSYWLSCRTGSYEWNWLMRGITNDNDLKNQYFVAVF